MLQVTNGSNDLELEVPSVPKTPSLSEAFPISRLSHKHSSDSNTIKSEQSRYKNKYCDICERSDFSESELIAHRKLVHHIKATSKNGVVSLHCAYCNENCKSRTELENHMKSHSQSSGVSGKHKCIICDELCPSAAILAEHKLTHCKVVSGNCCTHCKAKLTSDEQFYSHLIEHSNSGNNNNNANTLQNNLQIPLPTPCVICRQTLMSNIEVRMHSHFHLRSTIPSADYQCVLCLKSFDKPNVIAANGTASNMTMTYICKDCYAHHSLSMTYSKQKDMKGHVQKTESVSDQSNKYSCLKCQLSFENEHEIQIHLTTHLIAESTDHICHLCRSKLSSATKLQIHLIEHTFVGFGSYTCYICSAVFTAAQGLHTHMLEHGLAARPYDCPRCSSKFFFRAELDNHSFSHIEQDSLLQHSSFPLSTTGYLTGTDKEMILNQSINCSESPAKFSDMVGLLNHTKTHSGSEHNTNVSNNENRNSSPCEEKPNVSSREENDFIEVGSPAELCETNSVT